jgi:hypothetical protein
MREAVPTKTTGPSEQLTYEESQQQISVMPAVRVPWQMCMPEITGGEACSCQDSREGGFQPSLALASTVLLGYLSIKTARCGHLWARVLKAFSLLRFFVALDKEMTRRHAQWLIVLKK